MTKKNLLFLVVFLLGSCASTNNQIPTQEVSIEQRYQEGLANMEQKEQANKEEKNNKTSPSLENKVIAKPLGETEKLTIADEEKILNTNLSQEKRYDFENDFIPDLNINLEKIKQPTPKSEPFSLIGNKDYVLDKKKYNILDKEEEYLNYTKTGTASWYGQKFHGYKTSNYEIYDMFKFSAAHKTLPLPSYVKVTNLENNISIIVRVNDRGPFVDEREIDLSYVAAKKLNMLENGTAKVKVERIDFKNENKKERKILVQVFASKNKQRATQVLSKLEKELSVKGYKDFSGNLYKVRFGPLDNILDANVMAAKITALKFEDPYLIPL